MVNHECPKCKKEFPRKSTLDNHLKKKNTCKQLNENSTQTPQIPQNFSQIPQNFIKNPNTNLNVMIPATNIINNSNTELNITIPTTNIINCNYCEKSFARKDAALRHMNQYCPILKQQNKEKQEIFDKLKLEKQQEEIIEKLKLLEDQTKIIITKNKQLEDGNIKLENENKTLKKEIEKVQSITNNTSNIMNNNINIENTTNNIIMVSYGHEDMSKITPKMLSTACKKGYNSILHLIDMVHFNPDYPEFHNVYIPSVKDKHAMVYYDEMWNLKNKDDVVNDMYDTNRDYIIDNIEGINNFLNDGEKRALNRWLDSEKNKDKSEKDKKAIASTHDNLKLLLHNKRHIPIGTRKQKATITM